MRAFFSSGALAFALLVGSAAAHGAEPGPNTLPITVVALQTPDADDQAEALTKALRTTLRTIPGWSLGEGDFALEVLTISLKCAEPPDAGCQQRIGDQIHADRFVWGELRKQGAADVAGTLHLWTRGKPEVTTPLRYSANLTESNDEALRKVAAEALASLTGGLPKGSVRVKAGTVDGAAFVDGKEIGAVTHGEASFELPIGSHQVTVKANGFGDSTSAVVVKAAAVADVTLFPMPIEVAKPLDWRRVGAYAGLGAGAAFAIVGLAGTIQVASAQGDIEEFRKVNFASSNVCDDARNGTALDAPDMTKAEAIEVCDKAGTFEAVQAVFYPLAAISAGVGAYLLWTSPRAETPEKGLRVEPRVGKQSGSVDVTYRW